MFTNLTVFLNKHYGCHRNFLELAPNYTSSRGWRDLWQTLPSTSPKTRASWPAPLPLHLTVGSWDDPASSKENRFLTTSTCS